MLGFTGREHRRVQGAIMSSQRTAITTTTRIGNFRHPEFNAMVKHFTNVHGLSISVAATTPYPGGVQYTRLRVDGPRTAVEQWWAWFAPFTNSPLVPLETFEEPQKDEVSLDRRIQSLTASLQASMARQPHIYGRSA